MEPITRLTTRRQFVHAAGLSLGAAFFSRLRAAEPFVRTGPARLRLALAAYSFRDYFRDSTTKQEGDHAREFTMQKFIAYCAAQGVDGAELTSYYFPKDATAETFLSIRREAQIAGVSITGTSVGNNFALPRGPERDKQIADVKRWIENAALLGAPHIRVFAGQPPKGLDRAEAVKLCIEAMEECAAFAGTKGVFLGIENHHGLVKTPEELLEIVQAVKSPWLGINLDTGNFHLEDPYAALAKIAPYAVNVQIKTEIQPGEKAAKQPADLDRLAGILRGANYQGWVTLEFEEKADPWKRVPEVLAQLRPILAVEVAKREGTAGWRELFDGKSTDGWKAPNFAGQGEVEVKDGALWVGTGNDISGLNYTGEIPRMNYEVEIETARMSGGDFFCGLTFPVNDACATLVVGGWGGSLVGISSIDGNDASENETATVMKFEDKKFYRIRLRVTAEKLETWLDDKPLCSADIRGKKVGMRPGEIELSMPFGLATFRTTGAFKKVRVRRL